MRKKDGLIFLMNFTKFCLVLVSLIASDLLFSQIKIGDNPNIIDEASLLELESESRVFVLTRVTNTQMQSISPLEGALVYNIDERCIFNYDGNSWINLCLGQSGLTFVDNGDGTFTIDDGINPPLIIDGRAETITTLVDNLDGTFTYTSENGTITDIQSSSTTIMDNGDGTYTVNDGITPPITFNGAPETVTSLVDNGDGTITYSNENNDVTTVSVGGGGELSGTTGSIFFAGTTGLPNEDNTQLFWDNPTDRLGIGINAGLTDNVTVNGTIGTSGGTATAPAYRFIQDGSMGMYRNTNGELAFSTNGTEKMSIDDTAVLVNNANPFDTSPFVVRGKGVDQKLIAFQDENQGLTLFNLDFRFAGLHLDEVNKGTRLLIKVNEHMGVDTNDPQAALDVNGDFRVRGLTPTVAGDTYVTVDANGFFHRSTGTISSKGSSSLQPAARWTNGRIKTLLAGTRYVVPIFDNEDFKDGGTGVFNAQGSKLEVRAAGRYDIRANVSLLVSDSNVGPTNLSLRFSVNDSPVGAIVSIITNDQNLASLSLNEVLQLNAGDKISVVLYSESDLSGFSLNDSGTSSFIINKVK